MEETLLKAEEAFQAHLLTDHAIPHTIELSSKNKGRKIILYMSLYLGHCFPTCIALHRKITFSYSI